VVLNRRRDARARAIQIFNTITKHGKSIFNVECNLHWRCRLRKVVFWS